MKNVRLYNTLLREKSLLQKAIVANVRSNFKRTLQEHQGWFKRIQIAKSVKKKTCKIIGHKEKKYMKVIMQL